MLAFEGTGVFLPILRFNNCLLFGDVELLVSVECNDYSFLIYFKRNFMRVVNQPSINLILISLISSDIL